MEQLVNTQALQKGCKKSDKRIKDHFCSIATYVRNRVLECEICIKYQGINNTRITPELSQILERNLGPEYFMQIDLVPDLLPSGGYDNTFTAIDVFSRNAFAYPVFNPTSVNTAKVIIDIMKKHFYLPTLNITDKGRISVSHAIHKVAIILERTLMRSTTKPTKTIGFLERAHGTIKISLKKASGEHTEQRQIYLPIEILNHNMTYPFSIDCEPSRVFHGRVPNNILDHKQRLRFNPNIAPTTDFADELLSRTKILYDKTKKNFMQSHIKYKMQYDKKEKKLPL